MYKPLTRLFSLGDTAYTVSSTFWLGVGQFFKIVGLLVISVAFANLLSPTTYGSYKYLISIVELVFGFSLAGIPTVLAAYIARGHTKLLTSSFYLSILGSLPAGLITLGISGYYAFQGNLVFAFVLLIGALIYPVLIATRLYAPVTSGLKHFRANALLGTGIIFVHAATTTVVLMFTSSLPVIVLGVLGSQAFATTLAFIYIYFSQKRVRGTSPEEPIDLKRESVHMSAMNIVTSIATHIDRIIVFQLLGPVALAVYSFAIAIPEQIRSIIAIFGKIAFPKFAERPFESVKKVLVLRSIQITLFAVGASLLYVFVAPMLFALLFPQYTESVQYSQLLVLLVIFSAFGHLAGVALNAHLRIKDLHYYTGTHSVLRILLHATLIPILGIMGAVLASIVHSFISSILLLFFVFWRNK